MAEFLHTVVTQEASLAASSQTALIDLPVNPMSHILLTLIANNNTGTLTNYRALASFAAFLTTVEVLYKGQAIIQGSLTDLMIMNAILTGYIPFQQDQVDTNDDQRSITFMLSFSRVPYWMEEGFPATARGEFQIRLTSGAAPTGMDTMFFSIETVEILNATPSRFLKYTAYTGTASATGRDDRDLPRGNPLLGVLLFSTNISQTTSGVNTINDVSVRVDNVERFYSLANFYTLHNQLARKLGPTWMGLQSHFHDLTDTAASGGGNSGQEQFTDELLESYALLDFDPLRNSEYALVTEGRGRVSMRMDFGDTAAMRFMPVELVSVAGAAQT